MSVSFARAVADGLRAHRVAVHFAEGWQWRGNGQTSNYQGLIEHHTAGLYDMALPGNWIFKLLRDGREDLDGPLCNSAGNEDGSVTIMAAHPANHAGAAGGSWARPFPDTRAFNHMVWGHEICYPGNSPMRDAQYRTAQILGGVVLGILGKRSPEWVRGHYETSITGKWDPGYAPGRWIDMAAFRAGIWDALYSTEEDDVSYDDAKRAIVDVLWREKHDSRVPDADAEISLADGIMYSDAYGYQNFYANRHLAAATAGQTEALRALAETVASGAELDVDALMDRIDQTVTDAMARVVDVNVSVQDHTEGNPK